MQKVWIPCLYRQSSLYGRPTPPSPHPHLPFSIFFQIPSFRQHSFANITPMKNGINKNMLFSKSNTQKATLGLNLIWNNNNLKYQRETSTANEKPPSKEHYCYIIHALLIKNNAYPPPPPPPLNNPHYMDYPTPAPLFTRKSSVPLLRFSKQFNPL